MKFIYATYNQYCNSRNKAGLFYLTGTITFVDGRFQIKLIPAHIRHVFWKQILKEDFLDAIYDCLFEMHELVTDEDISKAILALKDVQKELLYQFAIKRYYYQLIAAFRQQTDRNIRKIRDTMLKKLRKSFIQATKFRIWATGILKEYMIRGFAMDDERLKQGKTVAEIVYQQADHTKEN